MVAKVQVSGLKELIAELRTIDSKLPRELTKAHRQVALAVVEKAQSEMASQPIPKAAEAAQGIKAKASQKGAAVALLGENPFVRAAEFGTITHHVFGREMLARDMKRQVFRPWSGNAEDAGYALHPTLRTFLASPQFEEVYFDAMDRVYAKAFPLGRF